MVSLSRGKSRLIATGSATALLAGGVVLAASGGGSSVLTTLASAVSIVTGQASSKPAPAFAANAGPDLTVKLPDTRVTLLGSVRGGTAQWTQLSGPAKVVFLTTNNPSTPVMADKPGTYKLRLAVNNANGKVLTSDTVVVRVAANPTVIGSASTPLDHVLSFNRPAMRAGNTLLPLTISSCAVSSDTRLELMKYWGYGGQLDEGTNYGEDKVFAELKNNPGKYPSVFGQASLYGVFENINGQNPGYPVLPPETYVRDANGKIVIRNGRPIVSPIAPDSSFVTVGNYVGRAARRLERDTGQKFTYVTNGGEYGLWFPGDNNPWDIWGVDPRVNDAMRAQGLDPRSNDDWFSFLSKNKARQERIIKETLYANLQLGRPLAYSWYGEGFGTERGRWAGWPWYNFQWDKYLDANGRPTVSDYASPEMYYAFHNTGWSGLHGQQGIPYDGLTLILRNAGGIRTMGQSLIFPWVSQGWDGGDSGGISDDDLYIGAMKAIYTSGAVGAAVGYYTCDGAPFQAMRVNNPVGTSVPTQVRGLINTAKVHALFTYLEPFLRNGDLLPGDGNHAFHSWDITTPAMEFDVAGETKVNDPWNPDSKYHTARVLARKMRGADRWLVTAWANTGLDRDVRVTIDPRLGQLVLRARKAGSVYIVELVNGRVQQRLVDTDAMNPTRTLFPEQGAL